MYTTGLYYSQRFNLFAVLASESRVRIILMSYDTYENTVSSNPIISSFKLIWNRVDDPYFR